MYCGCHNLVFDLVLPGADHPERILNDVTLGVERGEHLSIVGPSGSGKSTLLSCLAGNRSPTSGTVTLAGHPLAGLSPRRIAARRRRHVGFVYQKYNLVPYLTCRENLTLSAQLKGRAVSREDAHTALEEFGLLDRSEVLARNLSGGEQQRVAIARVVLTRPDVVFADEPTGALDRASGTHALSALRGLADAGSALVVVTHDLTVASAAHRVAVLADGALVAPPAPRSVADLTHMFATTRPRSAAT